MPLNNPDAPITTSYQPRLSVVLSQSSTSSGTDQNSGQELPMPLTASVTSNNWYQADRFNVDFALFNDPGFGPKFWGLQENVVLDVRYQLVGQSPVSLILGVIDRLDLDWNNGVVRCEGRDLTSLFIDHRTYGAFLNKTSSQIATELAQSYNMTADVDSTSTPVGRYYESEHEEISNGEFSKSISQWDLLTFLAANEGDADNHFNVWVSGGTLHFKKAVPIDTANPWIIKTVAPQFLKSQRGSSLIGRMNATSLAMSRSMTLASDVVVTVRSWNSQQRGAITVTSPKGAGSSTSAKSKSNAQRYVYQRPNLTKDQAQKLADSMRAELTKHERVIEWSDAGGYPGALQLTPRDALELQGTGSSWDQRYYIDAITRTMSASGGFSMTVKAKNHSTESQTAA